MFAVQPIRIYAGVQICQIIYHTLEGDCDEYQSKYQNNTDIQPSLLYEEYGQAADKAQLKLPFGPCNFLSPLECESAAFAFVRLTDGRSVFVSFAGCWQAPSAKPVRAPKRRLRLRTPKFFVLQFGHMTC